MAAFLSSLGLGSETFSAIGFIGFATSTLGFSLSASPQVRTSTFVLVHTRVCGGEGGLSLAAHCYVYQVTILTVLLIGAETRAVKALHAYVWRSFTCSVSARSCGYYVCSSGCDAL